MLCLFGPPAPQGNSVPDLLVRAHQNRMWFKTGLFVYEYEIEWPSKNEKQRHRFEARIAGDDIYWIDRGNDDGIRLCDGVTGAPLIGVLFSCSPKHIIRNSNSDEQWSRHNGDNGLVLHHASARGPFGEVSDPRSFGLIQYAVRHRSPQVLLENLTGNAAHHRWSVKKIGTIDVVRLQYNYGSEESGSRGELIWNIDSLRDFAVVEITDYEIGKQDEKSLLCQVTTEYGEFDGHWWPTRFEAFAPRTGVRELVVFHHVEFDRPNHPTVLNPDIWAIPAGVQVTSHWNARQTRKLESGHYIGGGVFITPEEWEGVKGQYDQEVLRQFWNRNFEIGTGNYPKWWASLDGLYGLANVERTPDQWEAFVRRWIIRHSECPHAKPGVDEPLTREQISAAWAILKDCRQRAKPILRRMREHDKVQSTLKSSGESAQVSPPTSAPADDNARQMTPTSNLASGRTVTKPGRHERELEDIFKLLKGRLIGLLRDKQKLDDEKTSAPAAQAKP